MTGDPKGRILLLDTGIVAVPYEPKRHGWWNAVVVGGQPEASGAKAYADSYPVGGYDISISPYQIAAAFVLDAP